MLKTKQDSGTTHVGHHKHSPPTEGFRIEDIKKTSQFTTKQNSFVTKSRDNFLRSRKEKQNTPEKFKVLHFLLRRTRCKAYRSQGCRRLGDRIGHNVRCMCSSGLKYIFHFWQSSPGKQSEFLKITISNYSSRVVLL